MCTIKHTHKALQMQGGEGIKEEIRGHYICHPEQKNPQRRGM